MSCFVPYCTIVTTSTDYGLKVDPRVLVRLPDPLAAIKALDEIIRSHSDRYGDSRLPLRSVIHSDQGRA